jgi:hypothetical protein
VIDSEQLVEQAKPMDYPFIAAVFRNVLAERLLGVSAEVVVHAPQRGQNVVGSSAEVDRIEVVLVDQPTPDAMLGLVQPCDPASTASTFGTGKRPAHQVMTAVSTEMSGAGPAFSIHCTPSSRVTRKTVAPDLPMTIGDLIARSTALVSQSAASHMPIRINTPAINASADIRMPGMGTAANPMMPDRINQTDSKSIPALRVIRIAMVHLQPLA